MRLTIVKDDNLVVIDKLPIRFDLSTYGLPENFHALQWYGNDGEEEFNDGTVNQKINDIDFYQSIIDEYNRLKAIEYNPPEVTETEKYTILIKQRNQYMYQTDWLIQRNNDQLLIGATASITYEEFTQLQHWRQKLRELDEEYSTSDTWQWPVAPNFLVPKYLSDYPPESD